MAEVGLDVKGEVQDGADGAAGRWTLGHLLAPVTPEEFWERHWEREHLFVDRNQPGYYGEILSLDDVERYLATAARHPEVRVSIGNAAEGIKTLKASAVSGRDLYRAFHRGRTLMLAGIERCWPPVAGLVSTLEQAFDARVKVNAYLTPPGHQGAPIHPDVQDVFALQLDGAKEWHLYEGRAHEPLSTLDHLSRLATPVAIDEEPPLRCRVRTRPGDLLYLPRGLLHRAVPVDDAPSVHLAVCVTPLSWVDFLKAAVEVASLEAPELTGSVGISRHLEDQGEAALERRFGQVLARLTSSAPFARTLELLRDRQRARRTQPPGGHLRQILQLDRIGPETFVERRLPGACRPEAHGEELILECDTLRIPLPAGLSPLLDHVCAHRSFRVAELPGEVPVAGKVKLIRRLVLEGLLQVVGEA